MKYRRTAVVWIMCFYLLLVYLFVSAPAPLQESRTESKKIPIDVALEILNSENNHIRALYTKEIVGAGKKAGLKFDEDWNSESLIAGPLPAQYLRLTARYLERSEVALGLFLGSDAAINQANYFEGQQKEMFEQMKKDRQANFFYVPDAERYAYMFPDIAVSKPCITCHNDHPDTPKKDWKLDDVMGATTWTYANQQISYEEFFLMLDTLRKGFASSYKVMLKELSNLENPPHIGEKWPRDGYYLPSTELFIKTAQRSSSPFAIEKLAQVSLPKKKRRVAAATKK